MSTVRRDRYRHPMPAEDVNPGTPDTLEPIWEHVQGALGRHADLSVFPATPMGPGLPIAFWPDPDLENLETFLQVARSSSAPILSVTATALPPSPGPGISTAYPDVVEQFPEHAGRIGDIEIGFAAGGVLHLWTISAGWWDAVITAGDDDSEDDGFEYGAPRRPWRDWDTPDGHRELQELFGADTLDAAVEQLLAAPGFIASPRTYSLYNTQPDGTLGTDLDDWRAAVHADDAPQREEKRAAYTLAHRRAEERATQIRSDRVTAALADLDGLYRDLQAFPGWAEARLADEHRRRIREFVEQRLGFRDPDVIDRLYTVYRQRR